MLICSASFITGCAKSNKYEVIERNQKEVPNFEAPGVHTEVSYVLLNNGHKFYATCDAADLDKMDPNASCAFGTLHPQV